jgi:hypothetical protein
LDEQGSDHPLELEGPVGTSQKRVQWVLVDTHSLDVSCRTQVTLDEEEIGLERGQGAELVAPTRTSLQETRVSLEEVVDVVQEVKRDVAPLQVVQQVLISPASERGHKLQLYLGTILETRSECLREIVGGRLLGRNFPSRVRVSGLILMVVECSRDVCCI